MAILRARCGLNYTAQLTGQFNATLQGQAVLQADEAMVRVGVRSLRNFKSLAVVLESAPVVHRHSAGFDNVFGIATDVESLGWDIIDRTDAEERLVYDLASEDVERWEMLQVELDDLRDAIGEPDATDDARWDAVQTELTILRNALATSSPDVDPGDLVAIFELALL